MAEAVVVITKTSESGEVIFMRTGVSQIVIETTDLHLGHTNLRKYISAVRLEIDDLRGGVLPQVEIGSRDSLDDPVVFTLPTTTDEGGMMLYTRLTSKYFRIRLTLSSNQAYFVWAALEFFGAPAGRRFV